MTGKSADVIKARYITLLRQMANRQTSGKGEGNIDLLDEIQKSHSENK